MNFWYFKFEGLFAKDSPEYPNEPFFSGCLLQADNYVDAEFFFFAAMSERKIILREIEEDFSIDPDELDLEDANNLFWLEWCEEVEINQKPIFDTFNLYPLEQSDEKILPEH